MASNLDSSPPLSKAILNLLEATLDYPVDPQAKARKLADDIVFISSSAKDATPPFWDIWPVVIELASSIAPGDERQDALIQSLNLLRRREGSASKSNELYLWKDLPDLSISVTEHWNSLENPSNTVACEDEVLANWKNFNSFLARLSSPEFAPWLTLSVWQLQEALEEPPSEDKPLTDCMAWVASEWIINSGRLLLGLLKPGEVKGQGTVTGPGKLCSGVAPRSIERWEFWKKRFSEMSADAASLGLEPATVAKVEEAVKVMEDLGN